MAKMNRIQFKDRDGDVLVVSQWPVVPGIVFETRNRNSNVGAMVEITKEQAQALIEFLGGVK